MSLCLRSLMPTVKVLCFVSWYRENLPLSSQTSFRELRKLVLLGITTLMWSYFLFAPGYLQVNWTHPCLHASTSPLSSPSTAQPADQREMLVSCYVLLLNFLCLVGCRTPSHTVNTIDNQTSVSHISHLVWDICKYVLVMFLPVVSERMSSSSKFIMLVSDLQLASFCHAGSSVGRLNFCHIIPKVSSH